MSRESDYWQTVMDAPLISITAHVFGRDMEIGTVHLDTFTKYIEGSRHILRFPEPAIAFAVESIEQVCKTSATKILVVDKVGYTKYHTTIEALLEKGFPIDRHAQGKQIALALTHWCIERKEYGSK